MKIRIVFLALLLASANCYSQADFKQVVDKINWYGTEADIIYSLYDYVEKSKHYEWDFENTESNYCFKNITISDIPIANSYIRVDKNNKKIYRLNFIFLDNETDLNRYHKIENYLISNFGKAENLVWLFDDYKMEASFIDMSNVLTEEIEKYSYVIRLEPIMSYYVNWENAIVENNNSRSPIPQIEYFKIDNENNVYIKEKNKELLKKTCDKIIPTPKGDVLVFDGGMFCYRKADNDIVYIKQGFAITYPITR